MKTITRSIRSETANVQSPCLEFHLFCRYSVYSKVDQEANTTRVACGSEGTPEHFETIYASIVFCIGYLIPLLLIIINYTCIIVYIKHQVFCTAIPVMCVRVRGVCTYTRACIKCNVLVLE